MVWQFVSANIKKDEFTLISGNVSEKKEQKALFKYLV